MKTGNFAKNSIALVALVLLVLPAAAIFFAEPVFAQSSTRLVSVLVKDNTVPLSAVAVSTKLNGTVVDTRNTKTDGTTSALSMVVGQAYRFELSRSNYAAIGYNFVVPSGSGTYTFTAYMQPTSAVSTARTVAVLVKDNSTGSVISGATVAVKTGSTQVIASATGADGKATFLSLSTGVGYVFSVSKSGYDSFISNSVVVPAGSVAYPQTYYLIPASNSGSVDQGLRNVAVLVKDKATGNLVSGATVAFKIGSATITTGSTGQTGLTGAVGLRIGTAYYFVITKAGFKEFSTGTYTIPSGDGTYQYPFSLEASTSPSVVSGTRPVAVRVKDDVSDVPLSGVNVTFLKGSQAVFIKSTGSIGLTDFMDLAVGEQYFFAISKSGYQMLTTTKVIIPSGSTNMQFQYSLLPLTSPPASSTRPVAVRVKDSVSDLPLSGVTVVFMKGSVAVFTKSTTSIGLTDYADLTTGEQYFFVVSKSGYQMLTTTKVIIPSGSTNMNYQYALVPSTSPPSVPPVQPPESSTTRSVAILVHESGTSKAISGATVQFFKGDQLAGSATTGSDGKTSGTILDVGQNYKVVASKTGFIQNFGFAYVPQGSGEYLTSIVLTGASTSCTDSDAANDVHVKGYVDRPLFDRVFDSCAGQAIVPATIEYLCSSGNTLAQTYKDCPSGETCSAGVCISSSPPSGGNVGACSDSDGGNIVRTRGAVSVNDISYPDVCTSSGEIKEYYCNVSGGSQSIISACPSGTVCSNGACISGTGNNIPVASSCAQNSIVESLSGGKKRVVFSNLGPEQSKFCSTGNEACATQSMNCEKVEVRCGLADQWSASSAGCSSTSFSSTCQYSAVCSETTSPVPSTPTTRNIVVLVKDGGVLGNPISGATVEINSGSETIFSALTGGDGKISAMNLRIGAAYSFVISKQGFSELETRTVVIPSGSTPYPYEYYLTHLSEPEPAQTRGIIFLVRNSATNGPVPNLEISVEKSGEFVASKSTNSNGKTPVVSLQVGENYSIVVAKNQKFKEKIVYFTPPSGTDDYVYPFFVLSLPPSRADLTETINSLESIKLEMQRLQSSALGIANYHHLNGGGSDEAKFRRVAALAKEVIASINAMISRINSNLDSGSFSRAELRQNIAFLKNQVKEINQQMAR